MPSLEDFLRTGHLGSIVIGMAPTDVMTAFGEPDDISEKSNPLILRYGQVQLTFWKPRGQHAQQLREIVVAFQPKIDSGPGHSELSNWTAEWPLTERDFREFALEIGYLPTHVVEGPSGKRILFPSGVEVLFAGDVLHSVRLAQRETKEPTSAPLSDEREPAKTQILEMLHEAERAMQAGAYRAALLVGWAGLEAVLRRLALSSGRQGKIGVQSNILLRELLAAGVLSPSDHANLERLRQTRMIAAHGLAPTRLDAEIVTRVIDTATDLLATVK